MSTVTALSNVADGRRMKADLQDLRRRGAIRTSECSLGESGVRSCSLCRAGLGWIVNRGAVCQACRKRVCKACREYAVRTVDWVCTVCYKRTQLQAATGEWMNEFIKKPKQWKDSKFSLSPAEIIKSTIRRSWTICDPNPRWSSSRDSPEFRPYNSLPRGRDVTDYPSLLSQRSVQTSGQSIDTVTSTEKLPEPNSDKEGNGVDGFSVSPRQRRVSQFERTLSELYGTKKTAATRKMSTSDENGLDKTSTEEDNLSSTSSNGIENRKSDIIKPSKIPARKKVQYTRSETSVINTPNKQPLRKQASLQPSRKQKERTLDETKEEKHVSFDYETTKKIDDLHSSPRCDTIKSNIPKSKTRNSSSSSSSASRSDSTSTSTATATTVTTRSSVSGESVLLNNNEITVETNCDINNLNRAQNEDNSKETTASTTVKEEPISGSLFRKVTIKKRRHDFRKTQAFDEGRRNKHRCSTTESSSSTTEFIDYESGKILLPEGDDYKLVFISSDSSSKEEDVDDNDDSVSSSSATTAHSFTIDDCDWDYFEPASGGVRQVLCWSNRNSPFGSPRVYRRGILESPLGSPLVYRRTRTRTRESDTGTDEDVTTRGIDSGSPVSSDSTAGFLSRMRSPSDTEDHLAMDATSIYVDHQTKHQQLQCVMHRDESTTTTTTSCAAAANNNLNSGGGNTGLVGSTTFPCHNCGAITPAPAPTTQFVPIPVLVPIPVPVPTIWNPLDSVILYNTSDTLDGNLRARLRAIQQRSTAAAAGTFLWPYVNQASLISQLISSGVTATDANTLLSVYNSTVNEATGTTTTTTNATSTTDVCKSETAATSTASTSSMPRTAFERNNNNATTQTENNDENTSICSEDDVTTTVAAAATTVTTVNTPSSNSEDTTTSVTSNRETTEGESNRDDDPDNCSTQETCNDDNNKCKVILLSSSSTMAADTELLLSLPTELPLGGYLASENTYMSSSESSDSSDTEDDEALDKPKVKRTYNVNGGNVRDSDDALPSSEVSSDCCDDDDDDDGKDSSERNDDLSSSGTDDTDSDDTGTVADQKSKKFYKVFVVNTNDSSTDIEDNTDSSSSDTDTSDNDTDTEKDCIVLNYMRTLDDVDSIDVNNKNNHQQVEADEENIEPVVLLKHRKSVENDESLQQNNNKKMCEENAVDNGIVLLKHVILKNDSDLSETDSICVNDSINSKTNLLSCNGAKRVDDDNTSASLDKNESDTTMITTECQSIDLNTAAIGNKKYVDNNKWECNTDVVVEVDAASCLDQNRIDASLTSISTRNAELIGEICAASEQQQHVSVENKQSTNDLETTPQQSNNPSTTDTDIVNDDDDNDNNNGTPLLQLTDNETSNCILSSIVQNKSVDVESAKVFPQEEKLLVVGGSSSSNINSEKHVTTEVRSERDNGSRGTSEWNTNTNKSAGSAASAGIRSSDPVRWPPVESGGRNVRGARTGVPTLATVDTEQPATRHVSSAPAARYTSLVMITQEPPAPAPRTIYQQVSVVQSDTTTIIPSTTDDNENDVIVQHTNWQNTTTTTTTTNHSQESSSSPSSVSGDTCAPDTEPTTKQQRTATPRKPPVLVTNSSANHNETVTVLTGSETLVLADSDPAATHVRDGLNGVTVVTGADTLSAVVCLEEGLADDDSWVEDISHDEDEFATTTATDSSSGEEVMLSCTSVLDQEEELRGYHRSAIDFTLHTIVEESCEESEVEQSQINNKKRPTSATDLEKYFFFRLGDGTVPNVNEDAFSETSSIYSEGMDSLGTAEEQNNDGGDPAELASSRLEKYFLSGFMGFTAERRDSDGSVGSDSEGRPSPEQRRKKLVRARGTGRSHSSSLDNLLANAELSGAEPQLNDAQQLASEDSSSSETDTYDDSTSNFEKSDGQFDTVKRKKCKKQRVISGGSSSPHDEKKGLEITVEEGSENKDSDVDDDGHKTPQPEFLLPMSVDLANSRKQQSRDSGFIGSCDDLLKEQKSTTDSISNSNDSSSPSLKKELKNDLQKITEEKQRTTDEKLDKLHNSVPPTTTLTRKDSFNNWSSDEETNLMMSKMRQFFKTMVANSANANLNSPSKPTTPIMSKQNSPKPVPSPRTKNRNKPPQLVYFENELTRLMKTVPGIRDDQVREIVEYLSSEDTWSDSYDSSDYTSSDLEGTAVAQKSVLQEQISASCQQIIKKFDKNGAGDEEGDEGDGGILDESQGLNRETAFVYQKLVASFNKMTTGDINKQISPHNSPPLIAKVMHHIGSRLVALMHEVSSGESHCSNSPKARYYHRRLQQKLSSASSTTTEDDDSTSDSNLPDRLTALEDLSNSNILPRSRSHDLLLGEARSHHHSSSGVSDIAEEREASDYERFSWRGSFESALMATDSRTRLSQIGTEGSASASALAMAAKRRSAGDLLFSPKSLSREQLDRVRSCGSIGGSGNSEEKHWVVSSAVRPNRRRSSVPDATCGSGGSADGEEDDEEDIEGRSTLPRSLQTNANTTNSLPRLPTSANAANMQKAQSMHHFLQHNVKSARYRPPGFNRSVVGAGPKRAVSAPGLQPSHPRRDARRRSQQPSVTSDDISTTESSSSPVVGPRSGSKSASPSPIHGNTLTRGSGSISSADCQGNDDDIDRLVAMHHNRNSLSSLGLRSDSMASVYSGAGEGRYGIVAVRGQVEFGLQYNYKAGALEICVKQCKDLAAVDQKRNRSDPYVKVYLLPDKSKSGKRKTKVKKHTLNPVFDETLKFHLSLSGLETRTLWLTVWHSDMFGRNDFLGEVMMPLENKVFDDPTPKWYNLQERTEPFEDLPSYKGDVIIGLKFVPPDMTVHKKGKRSRGALHVLVKEAKSLTAVKATGTSDPFCKSYLLPDKGRSNKQKTPILRRTTNPVWNHTFIYDDVTLQELAERALELTVWDHDRLASNEFLGGVRFSLGTNKHYGKNVDWMDATGKELALWQSMLERPNFWVEGCVTLRSSLDNRCS